MAYESSGRFHGADYFESSVSRAPDASAESRDNSSIKQTAPSQQRTSPLMNDKMGSARDHAEPPLQNEVSPELMERITEQISERIKRELVEHFKQTGNIEEPKPTPAPPPMHRAASNKSSSTSSPPPPTARRVYTPPSPAQPSKQTNTSPPMGPSKSPPMSPLDKPSGVRFSEREPRARPSGAPRTYSSLELSTIDKRWGRLFTNNGDPTERLGQVLRGLANHIIDEFMPKRSIVITPAKMRQYYSDHQLEDEIHPFTSIFRAQTYDQISMLYQDLGCQHHLVQEDVYKDPCIPALTPVGFAHWMTITILAYPEEEARRLQKVVLATPIDADGEMVDGKPERLPKQISRHLLPAQEDRKSRKLLDRAIADFFDDLDTAPRSRKTSNSSPPHSRATSQARAHPVEIPLPKTSPTAEKTKIERERMPYVGSPGVLESAVIDDAIKIERERQPYRAQPGCGKVHAENVNVNPTGKEIPTRHRATSTSRVQRDPFEIPDNRTQRTQSTASQNYTPQPTRGGPRRPSSPLLKSFSNSTPTDIHASSNYIIPPPASSSYGTQPPIFSPPPHSSSHSSTASFPPPPPPIDSRDKKMGQNRSHSKERSHSKDRSHGRRGTEGDARFGDYSTMPRDPREAERWDRLQDLTRGLDPDRTHDARGSSSIDSREPRGSISSEPRDVRGSVPLGPRDTRGASTTSYEEYYRDRDAGRGSNYDDYGSRRY